MAGKITIEELDSTLKSTINNKVDNSTMTTQLNNKINTSAIKNDLTSGGASNVLSAAQGVVLKGLVDSKADITTVTQQLGTKINTSAIKNDLTTGGASNVLSAEQGKTLKGLVDGKASKSDLNSKINTSAIKDDLVTGGASNVLSAEQGVIIKGLIDALSEKIDAVGGGASGDVAELIASKVAKTDIINDLITGGETKVLSAEQGKTLKGLVDGKASKSELSVKADAATVTSQLNGKINTSAIKNDLTTGGASNVLSAEQGKTLKGLVDSLTSKVNGKADTGTVTSQLSGKVNTADIINDLTTGGTSKVLSAQQGVTLKGLVDSKISTSLIKNDLTTGGASNVLSAEQGKALKALIDSLTSKVNEKADNTPVSTTVDGLMSAKDKVKLDTIAYGANSYAHPPTHPPSIIAQDATHRFMTDAERKLIQAWEEFKTNGGQIGSVITFPKGVTRQISQNLTLREKDYLQRMGLSNYNGYPCWSAIIEDPDNDENSNGLLFMLGSGVEGDPYKDNYVRPLKMGYAQKNNIGSVNVPWDDIYLRGVSKQANGYTKLPNGLIMQWGGKDLKISGGGGNSYISTSLPISFSSMILCCGATIDYNITENSGAWIEYINLNVRPNGKVGLHFNATNIHKMWTGDKTFRIMWFAVGY